VTRVFAEKESYESNLGVLESQQQRAADGRDIALHALPTLEPNGENIKAERVFAGAAVSAVRRRCQRANPINGADINRRVQQIERGAFRIGAAQRPSKTRAPTSTKPSPAM